MKVKEIIKIPVFVFGKYAGYYSLYKKYLTNEQIEEINKFWVIKQNNLQKI